jgi:hypothetical protein
MARLSHSLAHVALGLPKRHHCLYGITQVVLGAGLNPHLAVKEILNQLPAYTVGHQFTTCVSNELTTMGIGLFRRV